MQLLSCKNPELKDDFFPPAITHCVGKQTISHCSVYSTLSFTFCSEHTETLLEATAISMQEAKENLVSDLIQDKSMCTHLLFIAPISSRRDTVLEFQGYPCCLCRWKTDLGVWELCSNISQEFRRNGKSLNPGRFSSLSGQDFGKGDTRFTSPFLPSTEIQFPISQCPEAGAGELSWSLYWDAQIRCAREGQSHIHCCASRWCKSFSLAPSAAGAAKENHPAPTQQSQKPSAPHFSGCGLHSCQLCRILTLCGGCRWELPGSPVAQHKPSKAEFNIPPHASIFSH